MGGLSERRKLREPSSRLLSREVVVNGFRFFWTVIVIWYEAGTFFYSLRGCRWPSVDPQASPVNAAHVLLVSDAQVHNPFLSEPFLRRRIRRYVYNQHLKKSWHVAMRLKPQYIIFLGDMLATGKYVTDNAEYLQYFREFKGKLSIDPSVWVWHLPGNNDVGLGHSRVLSKTARRHFSETFGDFNLNVSLKNHTLLLLDAPGLVEEDYQRASFGKEFDKWKPLPGGAVEFVKQNAADRIDQPVILFSHIPLFRPDTKTCGPLRERGTIRRGVGTGYQNTLGKQTSLFLLDELRPSAVFSGDNRDYCDYTHNITLPNSESERFTVREVTVKSFSMANQIRHSGFQLLSIISPTRTSTRTFADVPCFLPDQYRIYTSVYSPLLLLTTFLLLVLNIYRTRRSRAAPPTPISLSPSTSRSGDIPLLHPDSAIWSPHTPVISPLTNKSVSPRAKTFPSVRTPNALTAPALRALSRPSTPQSAPLISPIIISHDDEDEESMYPPQYAMRRDGHSNGNAWIGGDADHDPHYGGRHTRDNSVHFLPAPARNMADQPRWSWWWTFNVRGNRLRMTINPWFLFSLFRGRQSGELDTRNSGRKRWMVLRGTVIDMFAVAWPALIVWMAIAQWVF